MPFWLWKSVHRRIMSACVTWAMGAPNGWKDRTRTCDKAVNSHLLYQLSYIPKLMWGLSPKSK